VNNLYVGKYLNSLNYLYTIQVAFKPRGKTFKVLKEEIDVDGTNNPKIPVGEKHSTKTFSPKIQLVLPKT